MAETTSTIVFSDSAPVAPHAGAVWCDTSVSPFVFKRCVAQKPDEWESLVGPAGAQGPEGPTGPTGDPGLQGDPGAPGIQGVPGNDGAQGPQGDSGVGVPAGGTTAQVLRKASTDDYDTEWATPAAGGEAFPIGSIFLSVVSTNPATSLGYGTWSAIAAGRMLVGLDAGDPDFDTPEKTGGAKAHTLTTDELPVHRHQTLRERSATTGGATTLIARTSDTSSTVDANVFTENAGSGAAHNNMPPHFVVYVWKRIA